MSKKGKIVFCTGGGCTAKLGAGALSRILEKLPRGARDPSLLVGYDSRAAAGLSALRHPLREVCFRAELAAELLCVPQDAQLTPELLANLLASEAGGRKVVGDRSFYVVLNQVDTKEQAALARQVADILKKIYRISCAMSHFEKGERA